MSLLLELALQRGTLSHILDAILLLLCLSNMPSFGADKNSRPPKSEDGVKVESPSGGRTGEGGGGGGGQEGRGGRSWRHEGRQMSFPLVHFLRRLGSISTPPSPYPSLKDVQEVGCAWAGVVFSALIIPLLCSKRVCPPNATWSASLSPMTTPPSLICNRWPQWPWLTWTALLSPI